MSELISDQFTFKEIEIYRDQRLGSGAYGVVCKAKCDLLPCAAKLLHPTFLMSGNFVLDKFKQECSFLASLKHPHIVQFLGIHTEPSSGQLALLLELMDGNLTSLLQRYQSIDQKLPYHTLINISHDVSLALQYLHSNGIIHRDLSSNNVLLLGECRAKITDFGMSRYTQSSSTMSSLTQVPGCPLYMPPEAWVTPPIYSEKLDVFSLGVLLVQMITCRQPNPGPLEVLIPDERSPTGFMKLPVSEIERRNEDISLISSNHPLKSAILQCLLDKSNDRPTSRDMCHTMESLKSSSQYKESNEGQGLRQLSHDSCASSDTGISSSQLMSDSLDRRITERDSEIEKMREKITSLEDEIKSLKKQLEDKDKLIEQLNEDYNPTQPGLNMTVLSSLSPEVLHVMSTNPESRVFHLKYDIDRGRVIFYLHPSESIEQATRVFLQIYQHAFNSCKLRVKFINVPKHFPSEILDKCTSRCNKITNGSFYDYLTAPKVIRMISNSPSIHETNAKLLNNILNLRMELSGGRMLTVKKGDIVDEDVSIIVSSANPMLKHTVGVSAAINVASEFEVQRHCNEYIREQGPIDTGEVVYTKGGGNLKCDWIIHASGPSGHLLSNDADEKFKSKATLEYRLLMHKILAKAEDLRAKSIALPAISTGSLMMKNEIAAIGIINGITSYDFSSSSLNDVRIILLNDDSFVKFADALISIYYTCQQTRKISSSTRQISSSSNYESPLPSSNNSSCKHQ
jgi:serine/threonine protein kinase